MKKLLILSLVNIIHQIATADLMEVQMAQFIMLQDKNLWL